jgi:hypothetical protein
MRRTVLLSVILFIVGSNACEENFSPKSDFEKKYAIFCILGISSFQEGFRPAVYVSSIYDVDGINPFFNEKDPTISGANVSFYYTRGIEYILQEDTTIYYDYNNPDSIIYVAYNKYNNPYIFYTDSTEIPVRLTTLHLDVELPDGIRMHAETKIPRGIFFEYSYDFPHGFTSNIDQWRHGDYWGIYCEPKEDHLYFISLLLDYIINDGGNLIYKSEEVPMEYVRSHETDVPIYPSEKITGKFEYKFKAVNKFFRSISEGIEDKSSITIYSLKLSVIEFNSDLAKYYSSTNGYMDEFSVRLDENIYNNIEGGIGIFAAYRSNSIIFEVDKDYIQSFGYRSIN